MIVGVCPPKDIFAVAAYLAVRRAQINAVTETRFVVPATFRAFTTGFNDLEKEGLCLEGSVFKAVKSYAEALPTRVS
jgi:hypothetical protein